MYVYCSLLLNMSVHILILPVVDFAYYLIMSYFQIMHLKLRLSSSVDLLVL